VRGFPPFSRQVSPPPRRFPPPIRAARDLLPLSFYVALPLIAIILIPLPTLECCNFPPPPPSSCLTHNNLNVVGDCSFGLELLFFDTPLDCDTDYAFRVVASFPSLFGPSFLFCCPSPHYISNSPPTVLTPSLELE